MEERLFLEASTQRDKKLYKTAFCVTLDVTEAVNRHMLMIDDMIRQAYRASKNTAAFISFTTNSSCPLTFASCSPVGVRARVSSDYIPHLVIRKSLSK